MLLPARVAVIEQVPLASDTDSVLPATVQPVDAPALNVTAPPVVPPVAVSEEVLPKVTGLGVASAVSAAWSALTRPTDSADEVTGL